MCYWILHFLRIPTRYYLQFYELQIKRYEFCKIELKSDLKFYFEIILIQTGPRGRFLLVRTGSTGSRLWIVGSKGDWADQIDLNPFG
jgi:hypothetical protein